jgi:hypothetical protein
VVLKVMLGVFLGIMLAVAVLVVAAEPVSYWMKGQALRRECAAAGLKWFERPVTALEPYGGHCR